MTKKKIKTFKKAFIIFIIFGIIISSLLTVGFMYLFELIFVSFMKSVFGMPYSFSTKIMIYSITWIFITLVVLGGVLKKELID